MNSSINFVISQKKIEDNKFIFNKGINMAIVNKKGILSTLFALLGTCNKPVEKYPIIHNIKTKKLKLKLYGWRYWFGHKIS